jgi:hypothetical protein
MCVEDWDFTPEGAGEHSVHAACADHESVLDDMCEFLSPSSELKPLKKLYF